jgi:TolB-like protein/Flp pilus assembly protein TadD
VSEISSFNGDKGIRPLSFFSELKQRNVIRVGIAYLAIAWLVIQVSNTILPLYEVSSETQRLIVLIFAIGLLPVLILAWAFEFTPEGIKLDREVDREKEPIRGGGKRLDRAVMVVLSLALAWFLFDKLFLVPERESAIAEAVRQQATTEALQQAEVEAFGKSIAVLPFFNASGDSGNDYLSGGISDELRDRLAQLPEVRVMARSSSLRISEQDLELSDVAEQFGVSRVIEGRFNRQGNRVLLSVQLIDTTSGFQIWSQTYERARNDLMSLQQDLAVAVVSRLMPELSNQEQTLSPSAQQVSAYDLLLLGRQYEQRLTNQQLVDESNLQLAIDYYQKVIEEDPLSAEAHARLGKMLLYQGEFDQAQESISKALELDPQLSDAHSTLGLYYWITRQDGLGAAYLRAVELNPNNADAHAYLAAWLWLQTEIENAIEHYRTARDLDPLSLLRHADLGYILAFEGYFDEALEVRDRILQLFPTAPGYLAAARISEAYGAPDEGIEYAIRARQMRPDDPDISGQLAEMYARIGDFDTALQLETEPGLGQLFWQGRYDELIDLGEELVIDRPNDADVLFLLAFAYNASGRFDNALYILELAGMPFAAWSESRRANELHALLTMAGALDAIEERERAVAMVDVEMERNHKFMAAVGNSTWIHHLFEACYLAVLGQHDEALSWLEESTQKQGAVWMPWLRDQACFQKFADEPRYQAVIKAHEDRLATIRQRLEEDLEKKNLTPVPSG